MKELRNYKIDGNEIEICLPSHKKLMQWAEKYDFKDYEKEYFTGLAYIISDPYNFAVALTDIGIDFENVTPYELFCGIAYANPDVLIRVLEVTLKINGKCFESIELMCETGNETVVILVDLENEIAITEEVFEILRNTIYDEYLFPNRQREKFKDELTKRIFVERQRLAINQEHKNGWQPCITMIFKELLSHITEMEQIDAMLCLPICKWIQIYVGNHHTTETGKEIINCAY